MDLSIVIPIYNEEESIIPLTNEIVDVVKDYKSEILFVNDGSKDNSLQQLKKVQEKYDNSMDLDIRIIDLARNSGQTAAMRAGFEYVSGTYVITMDGDGQNDPTDIPKFYEKITSEPVDVVCGWRKYRDDPLSKKIPSKFSNWLHKKLTGLNINDSGCTFRIYRAEAVKNLPIQGEDHRFLPAIIHGRGYRVDEEISNHRGRIAGKTKYGISRLWRGFFDLISTSFIYKLGVKPLQFFSKIASLLLVPGTLILFYLTYVRLFFGEPIADRPLLLLGIMLEIFGLQIFLTGLLAEYISYYKAQTDKKYAVRSVE